MATLREQANEKLAARAKLIKQNRDVIDSLEGKEWPAEDRSAYDARWKEIDRLKDEADRLSRQAEAEDGVGSGGERHREPTEPESAAITEYRTKFRTGSMGYIQGERAYQLQGTEDERAERMARFRSALIHPRDRNKEESRNLQMDSNEAGGFLVAPQQFVADLIQAIDDRVFFRGLARVDTLMGAHSVGRPSLDADPADADWTSELATGSEDSQMDFGKRELAAHPMAKRIKVSRKLLRHASQGAEGVVRERMAYKFGVTQEKAYLTGNGANKPLGVFTASNDGISTGRDVATDNTSTAVTFDGLKNAKWTLKQQYWNAASWIAHRDFGKQVDKIKDSDGRYIWQESVLAGNPDRLLGLPINFSEFAPNTFTTGEYVAVLGDFSNYWIIDSLSMEIQRLDELYAATNEVGFIGRYEGDGMPVLEEAFIRVKLG